MVRVHSNKRHLRDLAPVSKENKRCTSQQTRITIVEIVHRRPLADLVYQANLTVKRVNFSFSSWEKQVLTLVDGKRRNLALVSDFVSWDSASLVPRHKITHSCKIPPLSIHSWWNLYFSSTRVQEPLYLPDSRFLFHRDMTWPVERAP